MNESNNNKTTSGGIGFTGLLLLVFITLKLCKVIDWPWIWVLSPLWIGFIGVILIVLIIVILNK